MCTKFKSTSVPLIIFLFYADNIVIQADKKEIDLCFAGDDAMLECPNLPIKNNDYKHEIVVSFKTTAKDGVIFYLPNAAFTEHIALYLQHGYLSYDLRFDGVNHMDPLDSDMKFNDGSWHKVIVKFNGARGSVEIYDQKKYKKTKIWALKKTGLNLDPPCYLGGLPTAGNIWHNLQSHNYTGHLKGLIFNGQRVPMDHCRRLGNSFNCQNIDFQKNKKDFVTQRPKTTPSSTVTTTESDPCKQKTCWEGSCMNGECNFCSPNQCLKGKCVSSPNKQFVDKIFNFTCICEDGYGGPYCTLLDDPCKTAKCKNGGTCEVIIKPGKNDWLCRCQGKPVIGQAKDCSKKEAQKYSIPAVVMKAAVVVPPLAFVIACAVYGGYECYRIGELPDLEWASASSSSSDSSIQIVKEMKIRRSVGRRKTKKSTIQNTSTLQQPLKTPIDTIRKTTNPNARQSTYFECKVIEEPELEEHHMVRMKSKVSFPFGASYQNFESDNFESEEARKEEKEVRRPTLYSDTWSSRTEEKEVRRPTLYSDVWSSDSIEEGETAV